MPGTLTTVDEVLEALGGSRAVQELTEVKTNQAVWEWRKRGAIASHFYVVMIERLRDAGYEADPKLWGMVEKAGEERSEAGRDAAERGRAA